MPYFPWSTNVAVLKFCHVSSRYRYLQLTMLNCINTAIRALYPQSTFQWPKVPRPAQARSKRLCAVGGQPRLASRNIECGLKKFTFAVQTYANLEYSMWTINSLHAHSSLCSVRSLPVFLPQPTESA